MIKEDDQYILRGFEPLGPIIKTSLGQLIYDKLLEHRRKPEALIDAVTKKSISFHEIFKTSCAFSGVLRQNGFKKNDIAAISSENNLEFYIPVISTLYLGGIVAPLNPNYLQDELIHTLNITKPKIIFCSMAVLNKFLEMQNLMPFVEQIIVIDSCGYGRNWTSLGKLLSGASSKRVHMEKINPNEQTAFVMCSSGTTGLPKGVMQTHTNILVRYMHSQDPRVYTVTESFLGLLPFFHGYGFVTSLMAMLLGQKVIVLKRFDEKIFFQTIQDYKIETLFLAPPLIVFLAKTPLVNDYDLSSVKEIGSGAAPLGKEVEHIVKQRIKSSTIRQGYGLTEATLGITLTIMGKEKPGSSGTTASYMLLKIRDPDTGKSLPPYRIGEICCKGAMVMQGYFNNKAATEDSFTSDGWLRTGDLGYYDSDEYIYIVDRLKELIKYKGFQVAPAEIEALLLTHPKIQDSGVIGVPDDEAGELPMAFVVKKPNAELTTSEVVNFVAGKVSSQKRLRGGVIFVNAIPKSASGKILRRNLKQMLLEHKSKL